MQTLSLIFEMTIAPNFVFKGGTSLSKAWRLIERFSEDIDFALDRTYFGFKDYLSRNQIDKLRRMAGAFIDDIFISELREKLKEKGYEAVKVELVPGERSDRDRTVLLHFPFAITSPGYLRPNLKIEFNCRSLMEPSTQRALSSLVDEAYPHSEFAEGVITIPVVNPERTFLEKLFLLHEEFQRPAERIRTGDRLSRHLYDLVKLSKSQYATIALATPDLYQTIAAHRKQFNPIPGIDYRLHQPSRISPIPTDAVLAAWKDDYNSMREQMIYEQNPPTFDELIADLNELKNRVNSLPWIFDEAVLAIE